MPPEAPTKDAAPPKDGTRSDVEKLIQRLDAITTAQIPKDDFVALRTAHDQTLAAVRDLQKLVTDRSLSLPGGDDGKHFSFSRMALALDEGRGPEDYKRIAPYEFEVSEATRTHTRKKLEESQRAFPFVDMGRATLSTLVDNEGGFLVPTEKLSKFYDIFWAALVFTILGVTKLTPAGNAGAIDVPKATGSVAAYDIFEGKITNLAQSNPTFALLNLKPHECGVVCTATQRVLAMADPSIDAFLEKQMAQRLAQHMEDRLLNGSGANGQPKGLLIGAGAAAGNHIHLQGALQQVTDKGETAEQTISANYMIDFEGVLEDQNTPLGPNTKILSHPKVFRKFRKDTAAQYVYPTPLSREKAKEIAGYEWVLSTLLKTNLTYSGFAHDGSLAHLVMGNFEDFLTVMWGGVFVRKSDTTWNPINSTSGFFGRLVHFLGTALYDGGCIRSESIVAENALNYT